MEATNVVFGLFSTSCVKKDHFHIWAALFVLVVGLCGHIGTESSIKVPWSMVGAGQCHSKSTHKERTSWNVRQPNIYRTEPNIKMAEPNIHRTEHILKMAEPNIGRTEHILKITEPNVAEPNRTCSVAERSVGL